MRLRKIDFLRGFAVLLVIVTHHPLIERIQSAGWIGVDLFFVLSGFLVSGLLFNEYKRRSSINIGRFFIRRGLKIYPLFYVTLVCVITLYFLNTHQLPEISRILSEVFFLQSYFPNLIHVSWSLAVEEHFYILLMILMAWLVSARQVTNQRLVYGVWTFIAIACLVMRIITRAGEPYDMDTQVFPTHLRIDSLLAGVMISYTYHFNGEAFMKFFSKNRIVLWIVCVALISMPLYINRATVFMNTIGFTLLYIGFGLLLSLFLTSEHIDNKLDKFLTKPVVNGVAKIGLYSYGIYLWHSVVLVFIYPIVISLAHIPDNTPLRFAIYAIMGIVAGSVVSIVVEQPVLKLRDRYFPHS